MGPDDEKYLFIRSLLCPKEKFKLNIMYQSDTTGTYVNYLPEGAIANQILLRVLNLDSYDSNNQPHPDGIYDFIEGVTVLADNGKIIFQVWNHSVPICVKD